MIRPTKGVTIGTPHHHSIPCHDIIATVAQFISQQQSSCFTHTLPGGLLCSQANTIPGSEAAAEPEEHVQERAEREAMHICNMPEIHIWLCDASWLRFVSVILIKTF